MIRLAKLIRDNVVFHPGPDGAEFTSGQILFSAHLQDDPINIIQVVDRGGTSGVGGKIPLAQVQIIGRAETPGYAYDLLHAVYDSPAMGNNGGCLRRYRNAFELPAYSDNRLDLPSLKVVTMRAVQRPIDMGPANIGFIWSVNYEVQFLD